MEAYYNENDPSAAAWLRELIKDGHIAPGIVDERDIRKVKADELRDYSQIHLFAGIGGWSVALRLAGVPDEFKIWTGSCPCQPFSAAGKQKGGDDSRHLWPEMFRLVRECRPDVVFGEQVEGAIGHGWLDGISGDLEGEGYAVGSVVLGAHSVGAPHIRQRLYWVADARSSSARGHDRHGVHHGASPSLEAIGSGEASIESTRSGSIGGLAVADGGKSGDRELQRGGEQRQQPQDGGISIGLVNTDDAGPQRRVIGRDGGREWTSRQAGLGDGHWSASRLIECRDGKTRRIPIEPSFQPLVDGIQPGRVGILRGAGNAIVPALAAEFIEAFLASIGSVYSEWAK